MPRKQCRTILRNRGGRIQTAETRMVKLFDYTQKRESGWEEWQFQTRSQAYVDGLVADGKAEPVTRMKDGVVWRVGYRALTPTRPLKRSACTLTFATTTAVSKRAGGEDLTLSERLHVEKFEVWPLVGDSRGGHLVRPRMTDAEKRKAERMLGAHRLPIGATFEPGLQTA
jgi:hypothetical protein